MQISSEGGGVWWADRSHGAYIHMSPMRGGHVWLADRRHGACKYHQWVESHTCLPDWLPPSILSLLQKKNNIILRFCRITRSYVLFICQLHILFCGTIVTCILLIDCDVGYGNFLICLHSLDFWGHSKSSTTFPLEKKLHIICIYTKEEFTYKNFMCHPVRPERCAPPPLSADCWSWGKWGLLEYIKRGPSLISPLGSSFQYDRFLSCLAAFLSLVRNITSSSHKFTFSLY